MTTAPSSAELVEQLALLDVRLWVEGDRLRYQAAPGALSPELLQTLASRREELVGFLRAARTVHGLFRSRAERCPTATAVVFESQSIDYRTLDARTNQLARHLASLGVGRGSLVGVRVERSIDLVVGVLAVLTAGAAYVPLDPRFPPDRLAFLNDDAGVAVTLCDRALLPSIPTAAVCVDGAGWDDTSSAPFDGGATGTDLAYVIYTSGSTGRPKGVEIQHGSVVNLLRSITVEPGLKATDTVVAVTSASFDTAVADLYWPLSCGAQVVIASRDVASDGHRLAALLHTSGATLMQATPATWRLLLAAGWRNPERIRVLSTGEALPPNLAGELLAVTDELWNLYGPTETTVWSSVSRVQSPEPPILLGQPIAETRLYVVDAGGGLAPVGVPGELCIAGAGLARGYLRRPELTERQFVPDPFAAETGGRMYRTGDLARVRNDGGLEYLGRIDHQVKIRGYRIELGEIEAALGNHPDVRQAVVCARSIGDERSLVAYVVGGSPSVPALRAHLARTLPEYMVPSAFVVLDALPLGPTGKVDRQALPDPVIAGSAEHVAPRTPTERSLAAIWAELLGVPAIGAHDDFFALGGHSLLATRLVSRVRDRFGAVLPVRVLFDAPTLARFAEQVDAADRAPTAPILHDTGPPRLSFGQQRLWFLDQLDPGGATYHMAGALALRGPLRPELLRRVFEAIVGRHEVLRTRLVSEGGEPHPVVDPPPCWSLPVVDVADADVDRHLAEEAHRPFDLARGPLLRTTLLRLADDHHVLLVTLHHAVADGGSIAVLSNEAAALYDTFSRDLPSSLPPLPVQYADFASWQRSELTPPVLATRLAWWREELARLPALAFGVDRPPARRRAGARVPFVLPDPLIRDLERLTRAHGATLFMGLLAGFQVLLSRRSGRTDFAVGVPVANRGHQDLEPLIGFLVNTTVIRARLGDDPSFVTLLARVRQATLDAAHHDVPFDLLVDALRLPGDRHADPLFQVMLDFQGAVAEPVLRGLTTRSIPVPGRSAKHDLSLDLREADGVVSGVFEFDADRFTPATVTRMADELVRLLEGAVARPEVPVSELPFTSDADLALLARFSRCPETNEPAAPTVLGFWDHQIRCRPDHLALVDGEVGLTHRELDARVRAATAELRDAGIGAGAFVAIFLPRSVEMIVAVLAVVRTGAAYVPIDPNTPSLRIAAVIEDCGAAAVLTRSDLLDALPALSCPIRCVDRPVGATPSADAPLDPDAPAYVIYTSGTTGRPNGVTVSHRSLATYVDGAVRTFGIAPGERVLQFASLAFDTSAEEIFATLGGGATLVLRDDTMLESAGTFLARCNALGITILDLPTAWWNVLVGSATEADWRGVPALRLVIIGGEVATVGRLRQWHERVGSRIRLMNSYGPTEATIAATVADLTDLGPNELANLDAVPIGRPVPGSRIYLLDPAMRPVPIGVVGEIWIGGSGVAHGYRNDPERTAARFLADPFAETAGARMYRTGDQGRYSPDGTLACLGRLDHQVKIRGHRVELGEIEAILGRHGAIRQAVVIVDTTPSGETRLVGFVECRRPVAEAELREFCRAYLPNYMVPSRFVVVDALPMSSSGKVDRRALPAAGTPADPEPEPAPTGLEARMTDVWRRVLERDRLGVNDNFFDVGGHSLLLPVLLCAIRTEFATDLTLVTLLENPTIRTSAALFGAPADSDPALDRGRARASDARERMLRRRRAT